jgi:uncharacterized protein (DUF1697 family)
MTDRYVLLLRGINVNPSTRVAMADLRELVGELGYSGVKTLLQSGNVILDSDSAPDAAALESAIVAKTGVKSRVVILKLDAFRTIVDANPLLEVGDDLSKMVITFLDGDIAPSKIDRLSDDELAPERLVLTKRAIYQWCPDGILQSKLKPAFWKQFDPALTARNVRTVNRILEAAE